MPSIIDTSKLPELVEKHFGKILSNLGYTFSQAKTEGDKYFKYIFTYTNSTRKIKIDISNDFELINYDLNCLVSLYKLPYQDSYQSILYPNRYNHLRYNLPMDYDKYLIDQKKNLLEEVNRVLGNYAILIFKGDLLDVVKGKNWYTNIHAPRD